MINLIEEQTSQERQLQDLQYLINIERKKLRKDIDFDYLNKLESDWLDLSREIRKQMEIDRKVAAQRAKDLSWMLYVVKNGIKGG